MKQYKFLIILFFAGSAALLSSCKKQLDVINPNEPTLEVTGSEVGIVGFANGVVYKNGFNHVDVTTLNWLGDSYFSICYGLNELMADVLSAEAANQSINVVNLPDFVIYDNGVKQNNTASSKGAFRLVNSRDNRTQNPVYYEWAYMYVMNANINILLELIDKANFTGDAEMKKNTLKAWAYWWKGYAYSRIGSLYYAGIITDVGIEGERVSLYESHDKIIEESNKNLDKAKDLLGTLSGADYIDMMTRLIPSFCQVGHGGVLTTDMWLRNINTMKARNLLVNKRTKDMAAADWNAVLSLANDGVQQTDFVFTGRTTSANGFFTTGAGSAAILATGDPSGSTFKMSERYIQEFKTGDKRLANNFSTLGTPYLNQVGGFTFSNEHELLDGGNSMPGVITFSNSTPGEYELYIAGSYEENELMKAEANINLGTNVDAGLASVDAVRQYQGAGIAAVSGAGLTQDKAKEELRKERRVSLLFRGTSFYDYRRWGITDDITKGGGRTGAVVIESTGNKNTNATINYNFLDYWDVPDDETKLNPPAAGSVPVINPN